MILRGASKCKGEVGGLETRGPALFADEVHDPVPHDEEVGDAFRGRPMDRTEVRNEVLTLAEAPLVEIAHVGLRIDGHRPGHEMVIAPPEVVQALVLVGIDRHPRFDARPHRARLVGAHRRRGNDHNGDGEKAHIPRLGPLRDSHKHAVDAPGRLE